MIGYWRRPCWQAWKQQGFQIREHGPAGSISPFNQSGPPAPAVPLDLIFFPARASELSSAAPSRLHLRLHACRSIAAKLAFTRIPCMPARSLELAGRACTGPSSPSTRRCNSNTVCCFDRQFRFLYCILDEQTISTVQDTNVLHIAVQAAYVIPYFPLPMINRIHCQMRGTKAPRQLL
jgi:hypothetical protein